MDQESNRHHYLPRFYIKKFCNINGYIFVNDKSEERNYDNITPKVPKSIFFDWNRNSYVVGGNQTNVIEKIYRDVENLISPYLDGFIEERNNKEINIIPVEVMRYMIYLGYLTKWRVPRNDDYVNQLHESISFDDLNIFAKIKSNFFSLDNLVVESLSPEIKRLIFPTLLFQNKEDYDTIFRNTFIINFPKPLFITDNPFVELSIDPDVTFPSFIFPLASNSLLIYCDFIDKHDFAKFLIESKTSNQYIEVLYHAVQVTLMWHAKKYIGCEDKSCLQYFLSTVSETSDRLEKIKVNPVFFAFNALKQYKDSIDV